MKIKTLLLLTVFLLPFVNGQSQHHHCAHDSLLQLRNQQYPHIDKWENEQIKEYKKYNPEIPNYPKPQTPPDCEMCPLDIDPECVHTRYMLPVLVHIVAQPGHTTLGAQSNIPESQVLNAIATLNKQFSAQDISHPAAVNTGIQFYLAPVGPDSNGIFRYNNSISTDSVFAFSRMRGLLDSQYNNNNYIHIFVVDGILMSGVKGYATYPGGFNQAIVVQRRRFGNALDCSGCELDTISRNNVLAHEMGHFLNLHHTFYNGCDTGDCSTSGDKCCDTPPVSGPNFTCDTVNTCAGSPPDLIENFMDYTPETCAYLFTRDQMLRMHTALENYRTELIRPDLLFDLNPDICFLSAAFRVDFGISCQPDTFRLRALPYSKTGVQYIWTVYNQSDSVIHSQSDSDNPLFNFYLSPVGSYDVRLQVVYGIDTVSEYKKQVLWRNDCDAPIAHDAGNWFFGQYAGLVFTPNGTRPSLDAFEPPNFGPRTINTIEGGVSMSTVHGDLMFYGGGAGGVFGFIQMYNANHERFNRNQNLSTYGLEMHPSACQSSISFPCPWDTSKMLLLHSMADGYGSVYYSLIQENSNGLYELDTNNYNFRFVIEGWSDSIRPRIRESLTAAQRCDGIGHWIALVNSVRHSYNVEENSLLILSIDESGKFVIYDSVYLSNTYHNGDFFSYHDYFQAKFSPDGSKLALGRYLFDFDRITGKLSNKREFADEFKETYGLSFSPNSRYLYFTNTIDSIIRIDVTQSDLQTGRQSIKYEGNDADFNSMQLGPDNKLYMSNNGFGTLGVIHYPDTIWYGGTNPLGYDPVGASLRFGPIGGTSTSALPNFVEAKVPPRENEKITAIMSHCGTVQFNTNACCRFSYFWLFGDGDTASGKEVVHEYAFGNYNIKLVLDNIDTLYYTLDFTTPTVQITGSDTICVFDAPVVRQAIANNSNPASYQWSVTQGSISANPSQPQEAYISVPYGEEVWLSVLYTDLISGCTAQDSTALILGFGIDSNTINHNSNSIGFCELDSNRLNITGGVPISISDSFAYQWFVSHNNDSFVLIEGQTQKDLINYIVDSRYYFKRKAISDFCYNYSNIVEMVCKLVS